MSGLSSSRSFRSKRGRVLRLAALARSYEDVVGPHFGLRQGLVTPSRVDRHQAIRPRLGNLFRVGGQDDPLGQVFCRTRGLLAREPFDLQPDLTVVVATVVPNPRQIFRVGLRDGERRAVRQPVFGKPKCDALVEPDDLLNVIQ